MSSSAASADGPSRLHLVHPHLTCPSFQRPDASTKSNGAHQERVACAWRARRFPRPPLVRGLHRTSGLAAAPYVLRPLASARGVWLRAGWPWLQAPARIPTRDPPLPCHRAGWAPAAKATRSFRSSRGHEEPPFSPGAR